MNDDDMLSAINVPFRFRKRPISIPGDLRIEWRVAVLALILNNSHGKRATMKQLHVLNWAIRTSKARGNFIDMLNGGRDPNLALVRFEPALNRAVDFAIGEGLLARTETSGVGLTPRGQSFAVLLEQQKDCLLEEKAFLRKIKGKTTQKKIDDLLEWRS